MRQAYATLISLAKNLEKQSNKNREGLTARQYMIIQAIENLPKGERSMVNIARKIGTSKQNVTRLIPVLERKGFVLRTGFDSSRRATDVRGTDSGYSAMRAYTNSSVQYITGVFDGFTETEVKNLLSLLKRLRSHDGDNRTETENDDVSYF